MRVRTCGGNRDTAGALDETLYYLVMQIAVVIPDEMVEQLDRLVPGRFRSRAEAVRHALDDWLAAERIRQLDNRYADAYAHAPQSEDQIDSARLTAGRALPNGWEDLTW